MKRSPENIKFINDWISFARENLLFARAGMDADFSPYHSICFMCQGSAEKYLKAFLLFNGWKLKKTHDLSELLEICCDYNQSFKKLFKECEILNEYITEARYPAALPFESISKKEAEEAIKATEKIENYVLKNIKIHD